MAQSSTVTLPALKSFAYQGQEYRRGDLVAMSPLDAAIYARQGRVSLTRTYQTRQLVAERPAKAQSEPKRRRRSRKRASEATE